MDIISYILEIDIALFEIIHSLSGRIEILDWLGAFFAEESKIFMGGLFFLAIFLIYRDNRGNSGQYILLAVTIFLLATITSTILREAIIRPRPFVELDISPVIEQSVRPSLPSNHAAASFAIAGIYLAFVRRHFKTVLILACLVALARIYTGTHYPLDVITGAIIGFFPGLGIYYNINSIEEEIEKKNEKEKSTNNPSSKKKRKDY